MPLTPIDTTTDHGSYKGDPAKTAFGKVNDNDAYLDGRISTVATAAANADTKATNAASVAAAAVPKAGGEAGAMTGNLVFRGAGSAVRRMSLFHNANSSADYGATFNLEYSASTTPLAGLLLLPVGANGYVCNAEIWLKDGDFYNSPYAVMFRVSTTGISYRGNAVWHAGNTTVDANNFIKRA